MIRKAKATDAARIRHCAERAYLRYVAAIGRKPAPMVADFAAAIAAGHAWLAEGPQGEMLGFIVFFPDDDHMLLENVAVMPETTGKGVGKALIRHCEDAARRAGLRGVTLYTNAKMTENLSIYPRLGYAEVGRRHEDGFDRIFFEKTFRE